MNPTGRRRNGTERGSSPPSSNAATAAMSRIPTRRSWTATSISTPPTARLLHRPVRPRVVGLRPRVRLRARDDAAEPQQEGSERVRVQLAGLLPVVVLAHVPPLAPAGLRSDGDGQIRGRACHDGPASRSVCCPSAQPGFVRMERSAASSQEVTARLLGRSPSGTGARDCSTHIGYERALPPLCGDVPSGHKTGYARRDGVPQSLVFATAREELRPGL